MTFKANVIRGVIMVLTIWVTILLTLSLPGNVALVICFLAAIGALFFGTGVGLSVDNRDARKRRHAPLGRVK